MTRFVLLIAGVAAGTLSVPAYAQRTRVQPYIEAGQVLTADLQGGDVLTYSTVAAGVDAQVSSRRVEVAVSYRYERRFAYDKRLNDDDIHSGLARIRGHVAPGLTIEAGGIATRARSDIRGDAANALAGNVRNTTQVYSGYAGPNFQTRVGPVSVNAAYRFGYTRAEAAGATGVPAGAARLDAYDDSTVHVATASASIKSGTVLPVGVTVSGSYTREDAGQLDQRFEGKYARGDVVLPVGRGLAVGAGAGYEQIEISQREPLRNGSGVPVVDGNGRFVTDPASPRRLAYDIDGIFWDAGVIWRPSRRTFLEARIGERYDSMTYTGSLSYQMSPGAGVQIGVYDTVTTFGQQLNGAVSTIPAAFVTTADPFGNNYSGCVFGATGASAGTCLSGVFASTVTTSYRARGATGVMVLSRGPTRLGAGGSYQRRTFLSTTPASGITINGTSDESFYGQVFASQELGPNAALSGNAFASYYTSDLGPSGVLGWGTNAAYTHRFGKLGATASVGVFGFDSPDANATTAGQAALSLRYGF